MSLIATLLAVCALCGALVLGVFVHECLHALCLRAAGVPCSLRVGGEGDAIGLGIGFGAIASVRMDRVPPSVDPWQLRVAALSPLVLTAPLFAIALGVVPDPFAVGTLYEQTALVGWLACALPSPQDFSQYFHAEDIVEGAQSDPSDQRSVAGD